MKKQSIIIKPNMDLKEIISDKRPAFTEIIEMCKEEKLDATAGTDRRMGFAV